MDYRIIEGAEQMRLEEIVRLLRMTYWADKRPIETIETSVRNSACFGIRLEAEDRLIGFARVVTDDATTYYLCDVVIDAEYRRQGLGTALLAHIEARYAGLRGLLLTRDAQPFYRKFGYEVLNDRAMGRNPKHS